MADTPFLVNGAAYDGTSWNLALPSFLRVEKILRQARSISFEFVRSQVEHRLGRSEFSNGLNNGRFTPGPITLNCPVEAWIEIMPLLAARSPDGKTFGKARPFDFSIALKKQDDSVGSEIKFFQTRWLGPSNPSMSYDADGLFADVTIRAQYIEWDGYRP